MLNYANASGVDYAALTDGNHWELYSVFERGQLDERRILEVSIVDTPVHECALKLLLLWRPNLASGRPAHVSPRILGEAQRPPSTPARPTPAGDDGGPPLRPTLPGWVALSEYSPPSGTPCPAAIRFWDGHERTLKHWYEILTGVVEKLYSERRLTIDHVPIQMTASYSIVHTERIHPTGRPFDSSKIIDGTPLFVNVSLSAQGVRKETQKLLTRYGVSPAEVQLRGGS